jgi:acetyl-CoA carboxylase biotin carboxylase subunit
MQHEAFKSGKFDTHFVKNYFNPSVLNHSDETEMEIAAVLAIEAMSETATAKGASNTPHSSFNNGAKWRKNRLVE